MGTAAVKICSKCGQPKESSEFYADKRYSDGLYPSCKDCKRDLNRKVAADWYDANAEAHIANVMASRPAHEAKPRRQREGAKKITINIAVTPEFLAELEARAEGPRKLGSRIEADLTAYWRLMAQVEAKYGKRPEA